MRRINVRGEYRPVETAVIRREERENQPVLGGGWLVLKGKRKPSKKKERVLRG